MKELLFSLTKKDFEIQTFKSSGNGGQHRNKTETAVRIIHKESGAIGECVNYKSQYQNKKEAFKRLVESEKFQKWHKMEVKKRMGYLIDIDEFVENQMQEKNIKIETKDENGNWIEIKKL